jgi:hypothetical protein
MSFLAYSISLCASNVIFRGRCEEVDWDCTLANRWWRLWEGGFGLKVLGYLVRGVVFALHFLLMFL